MGLSSEDHLRKRGQHMQRLGIGVIGCGFVGRGAHVPGLSALETARLVAVADSDRERGEADLSRCRAHPRERPGVAGGGRRGGWPDEALFVLG